MNDFEKPITDRRRESLEQAKQLERMLDDGLDDIEAGRTVPRDEIRREIEAMFSAHQASKTSRRR